MRAPRSASRSSVGADQRVGPEPPAPAGPTPMPPPRVVAASSGSDPIRAASSTIASVTVRAIGPAVSWLCAIGTMPLRLTSPSVGLMPTSELLFDGETIDPSVSVPTAAAQRSAAAAAPDPELEPDGLRSSAYGFFVSPPRPPQLRVEGVGNRQRVGIRLEHAVQRRTVSIDLLDAREVFLDERSRRVASRLHALLQIGDRGFLEVEARRRLSRQSGAGSGDARDKD